MTRGMVALTTDAATRGDLLPRTQVVLASPNGTIPAWCDETSACLLGSTPAAPPVTPPAFRLRRLLALAVVLGGTVAAGCSNNSTPGVTPSEITSTSSPAPAATTTAGPTGSTATAVTTPTTSVAPTTTTTTTQDGTIIEITVVDGTVSGGGRIAVMLGDEVVLRVVADVADQVHVHGYDVSAPVSAGAAAELRFTAEIAGVFEVELENSGLRLAGLEVGP